MRKYLSLMRIRFIHSLQYRAAALAGVATQFAWGSMYLLMFQAFYRTDPGAFPMEFSQLSSYIWLQQAFFSLFSLWNWDNEIVESIRTGQVAYELIRPMNVYTMWYTKTLSVRLSRALLRCIPILVVASLLAAPYSLTLPRSPQAFVAFLISMAMGVSVLCALSMLVYIASFYTINSYGLRILVGSVSEVLTGGVIPLSFMPDGLKQALMTLPFGQVQDLPLRIYNGQAEGMEALYALCLQGAWLIILLAIGQYAMSRALRRTVVQGG